MTQREAQPTQLIELLSNRANSCLRALDRASAKINILNSRVARLQEQKPGSQDVDKFVDLAAKAFSELKRKRQKNIFFSSRKRAEEDTAVALRKSEHFHGEWYCRMYPDVSEAALDPVRHYIRFGFSEGRWPSPLFDTRYYLRSNEDVLQSGINPLYHFISHGLVESRNPNAIFDIRFYRAATGIGQDVDPIAHYCSSALDDLSDPSESFSNRDFMERNPLLDYAEHKPLAYALHGADLLSSMSKQR
jgi:hypothetical protein